MNKVNVPNLLATDYAFQMDSGRVWKVSPALVGPGGEGTDILYTIGQVDSSGAWMGTPTKWTLNVRHDGVAQRSAGFMTFWRRFINYSVGLPSVTAPEGLAVPGPTVVNGETWYAGKLDPAKGTADPNILCPDMGNIGDWYADLGTGNVWKKRIGEIEHFAGQKAMFEEAKVAAAESAAALGLPSASS